MMRELCAMIKIGVLYMARQLKTQTKIDVAYEVLSEQHPMTVRQVYYQLVSRHIIENSRSAYQGISTALVDARRQGDIPWDWIEDRIRRPRRPSMWTNVSTFMESVRRSYHKD